MKDLSKLSDADLDLLAKGEYAKMSEAGLIALKDAPDIKEDDQPEESGGIVSKFISKTKAEAERLKQKGWENLSRIERADLMAMSFAEKAGDELLGVGKKTPGMLVRAVPVAVAQKLGELTRIPGAPNVLGAVGGVVGEIGGDILDNEKITAGKLLESAVQGAVRGKSLANARTGKVLKEGAKMGWLNVAADEARQLVDTGELAAPSATAFALGAGSVAVQDVLDTGKRAENARMKGVDDAVANQKLSQTSEAGYAITPRRARPSDFERTTNKLVRKDIGLQADAPLSRENILLRKKALFIPYQEVAALSPEAKKALETMQEYKAEGRRLRRVYDAAAENNKHTPEMLAAAKAAYAAADAAEQTLIDKARDAGKVHLAEKLINNRPVLAKVYLAERAINFSKGIADASVYGKELDLFPERLTGEAMVIGDAYNANQLKEASIGNLLSRVVTVAKAAAQKAEHSSVGQPFSRNVPSYYQSPDVKADLGRLSMMQAGGGVDSPAQVPPGLDRFLPHRP